MLKCTSTGKVFWADITSLKLYERQSSNVLYVDI